SSIVLGCLLVLAAAQTKGVFERAVGPCINDKCPSGSSCYYAQCIPTEIAPVMPTPDIKTAIGPCGTWSMCEKDQFCFQTKCYPHPNLDALL
ncbi:hypothetical protein PFISCL1PPCAC_27625, partial [Pristionchus fissidentatus]